MNQIVEKVDVNAVMEHVDIDQLMERTDLGPIIASASSGAASDVVDVGQERGCRPGRLRASVGEPSPAALRHHVSERAAPARP